MKLLNAFFINSNLIFTATLVLGAQSAVARPSLPLCSVTKIDSSFHIIKNGQDFAQFSRGEDTLAALKKMSEEKKCAPLNMDLHQMGYEYFLSVNGVVLKKTVDSSQLVNQLELTPRITYTEEPVYHHFSWGDSESYNKFPWGQSEAYNGHAKVVDRIEKTAHENDVDANPAAYQTHRCSLGRNRYILALYVDGLKVKEGNDEASFLYEYAKLAKSGYCAYLPVDFANGGEIFSISLGGLAITRDADATRFMNALEYLGKAGFALKRTSCQFHQETNSYLISFIGVPVYRGSNASFADHHMKALEEAGACKWDR